MPIFNAQRATSTVLNQLGATKEQNSFPEVPLMLLVIRTNWHLKLCPLPILDTEIFLKSDQKSVVILLFPICRQVSLEISLLRFDHTS